MYLKNFIIILMLIIFSIGIQANAMTDSDYISTIEQNLFNTRYNNEPINSRLNRIEQNVFGQTNKDNTQKRIQKIRKIFTEPIPQTKQTAQSKPNFNIINPINKPAMQTDPLAQYPVIDEIERRILKNPNPTEDIYKRLDRLEISIFNRNFNDPLTDRVERLKLSVLGTKNDLASNNATDNNSEILDPESLKTLLIQLEKETLTTTYPNDPLESRLDRLEMQTFNQTSPDDPVNDRIERLATVIGAKPTSELYNDMSQLRQYQALSTKVTAAAFLLMMLKSLLF